MGPTDTVLVVDDSLTVRMDLVEAFEGAGLRAIPCATAEAARAALHAHRIDAAVLDVILPDGNGVELLEELRARGGGEATVIVMLSSEAEVSDRIRGLTRGADEYVGKPYDAGYVVAKVNELLRERRGVGVVEQRTSVLLIDDSATFREALRDALVGAGYDVLVTNTGEEGLRVAAARRPNAIIVDDVLPGIDGAGVIRRVRLDAALRGTLCVLLTGSDGAGIELRALDAGADAFLRKDEDISVILARFAAALRAAAAAPAETMASLLGPKRILAVDDSLTFLGEVGDALRLEGYDVVPARSGEEAIELLGVQLVDCILLDLQMPGIGGEETCRRIKAAPVVRDIPLIVLTGAEGRTSMIDCLGAGADDYISKSSDLEVLKARVRAQLRRKQFEDETRRLREQLLHRGLEAAEARAAHELSATRASLVKELEIKNAELASFTYSVSHDLHAPLRTIHGFTAMIIEDHADALGPQGRNYFDRVCRAATRMGELIDDLLALSHVGRAELHRMNVDVTVLAEKVASALVGSGGPSRVVEIVVEPGMTAYADARLLQVVFENLVGNAWKFTSKTPAARIAIGTTVRDAEPVFQVRDNGAGFDMTYAAKLFTPFQRLHSESEFDGTGIGLATIRRIVERHGGAVWAEGTVGRGATVSFTMPRPKAS